MVKAHILAKIDAGREDDVFSQLSKLSDIRGASTTYGIYDMILDVEFSEMEKLDEFVFNKLRKISGMNETVTVIISRTIIE